jgi:flavin-binding protein dodecin
VVGVSTQSSEDAAKRAVETASKSIRDLRIAEVTKMDMKVEGGKVLAFRTRVALSFKYEGSSDNPRRGRRSGRVSVTAHHPQTPPAAAQISD